MHNDRHSVGKIGCHLLNSQPLFLGYLKQDCQYILGLGATYCGYQRALLAMAVFVRQEREQVVLEGGLVDAQTLSHIGGKQHPVLCVPPLSPLSEPAQRVLLTTLKVVSVSEIVLTKATCSILIHDYKGTSFHGIYLNGWIFLSYQTRIFAGEPFFS